MTDCPGQLLFPFMEDEACVYCGEVRQVGRLCRRCIDDAKHGAALSYANDRLGFKRAMERLDALTNTD